MSKEAAARLSDQLLGGGGCDGGLLLFPTAADEPDVSTIISSRTFQSSKSREAGLVCQVVPDLVSLTERADL